MDGELEQLGERIAEQAAHLDAAMHRLMTDLREFDKRGGWYKQGALSCAHWLSWRVGWSLVVARDHVRVAHKLAEFPAVDDALRRGEISYSKVRAMVRVATPANEQLLLEHARLMPASQLELTCRKYALVQRHSQDPHPLGDLQRRYVRRRDTEDGMVKIEAVLHPEEGELVWTMLNHAATQITREPRPPVSSEHAATDPGDDSAESQEPAADNVRATPAAAHAASCPGNDSAEARTPMRGVRSTSDVMQAAGDVGHDSAESLWPAASNLTSTVTIVSAASCPCDDSAESLGPAASNAMSTVTVVPAAGCPGNDSPETQELVGGRDLAGTRTTGEPARRADDSAESQKAQSYRSEAEARQERRTFLEELLDEVDALRDAEAAPVDDREGAPREADSGHDHRSGRQDRPLHQRADAVRRAFNRADALVALAQGYLRGDRLNRAPLEVTLTIPASSLRRGSSDPLEVGQMGESFVSWDAARRLSCDCGVVEVIEDEHGTPLSVGRKRRTIAGQLKRALHARDKTCTFPGCTNRLFLEAHHIKHWADGGDTAVTNAALLCTAHHHFVHEYGYSIELDERQRPRFRDPHGRLVAVAPERPVSTELGWPRIRAQNEALAIDAETIACEWDGRPVPYGAIIGHLVAADGLQ